MTISIDLLIENIGQLCVMPSHAGGPQRGWALGDLALIHNAALAIHEGRIVSTFPDRQIPDEYDVAHTLDAGGRLVTPGLIDAHTHLVWAGDRAAEFEQRLAGISYQQIMAEGGGINRTVQDTRAASLSSLIDQTRQRLDRMLAHGTTTLDCKTGYGLDLPTELHSLDAIARLNAEHPLDLVPTFLGAHAIPPEYADRPDAYVQFLIDSVLPAVCDWRDAHRSLTLYCDVFCEDGAFTLDQSRRILEAARGRGLPLRVHADEFASIGGTALAVELGAATVDHLLATTAADVALLGTSNTIAVLLPATPFGLNIPNTAPARGLLEANAIIAIATDCNPGTAWCESMQMVLALATRTLRLTQAQALAAATINAAFAVGCGDQVGSLEPGKRADLVIWDVDDYRQLGYRFGANLAHTVIKNGRVVTTPRF